MGAVYKRELKAYMNSMTGPLCIGVFVALVGLYFYGSNIQTGYPIFSYSLISAWFVLLLLVPVVTMRSFADEKRQKTDQILLTSPLSIADIVLGKFFAMCSVFLIPMILFCIAPLIIKSFGNASLLTDYTSMLAYFVMICVFVSIGMFISSLLENIVITAVCTFAVLLVIYLWTSIVSIIPTDSLTSIIILLGVVTLIALLFYAVTKNWIAALAVELVGCGILIGINLSNPSMFEGFFSKYTSGLALFNVPINFIYYQIFDLAGMIRMLLIIVVMLFLTGQSLQKRRWS